MCAKIDENFCPLCQQENGCMAHSDERCWCMDVKVPQALLDLVAEMEQGQACICRSCIEKFNADRSKFITALGD